MWLEYFKEFLSGAFPRYLAEKPWNYKDDLCVLGAEDLARATGDTSWTRYILGNASHLLDPEGRIKNWDGVESNLDKISFGKSLRVLRDLTGEGAYAVAMDRVFAALKPYPRTETGNFWHKSIYPNQVWLDGLYMAMPFYAKVLDETGGEGWDDILNQFQSAHRLLWNEDLGLYMHACDCSREAEWADRETGRSPAVWLRAEGWFLMALADVYELARKHTPRAGELSELLRRALKGLLKYQVPETRMFLQVVDRADLKDNYSETSGSAMAAYALMKGARLGMVEEAWGVRGSEVLDGIRET